MTATTTTTTRRLWHMAEPIHATTYFAQEALQAFTDAGLRGFWRGYFAGRAAPLGRVGPGAVTAIFFGFAPGFVERAIPSVWSMAEPARVLEARLAGVDASLPALLGDMDEQAVSRAADEVRRAMEGGSPAGRPLFAANLDQPWPETPHVSLWHATTLVREHRGDGHVAALTEAGLDACESHLTQIAARGAPLETIAPYRGWEDDDWRAAQERLRSRGWFDDAGGLTDRGVEARQAIEDTTDRLAAQPWSGNGSGTASLERAVDLLEPLTAAVVENGNFPYPNPIGLPRI